MTIRCSWCNSPLEASGTGRLGERRIARQLCDRCRESFLFQMGVPLQAFLDSLPAPIFVVDDDVRVKAVNSEGRVLLGKEAGEMVGRLGGVVFDCAFAQLPEGCGRTVHCSGCAIRRSVFFTWETGEGLTDVPATLQYAKEGEPQQIELRISTERMGDTVLLRVEKAAQAVHETCTGR